LHRLSIKAIWAKKQIYFKGSAFLVLSLSLLLGIACKFFTVKEFDSRLVTSGEDTTFVGHPFTGIAYSLYRDYRPQHVQFFFRGKQIGTEYLWYPDGTIMAERPYKSGKPHGRWKMWYEDGSVRSLRTYVDGVIDGEMWGWHANGQVSDFNVYDHGKEITHKSWISDGTPFYNYVYQDSKRVGMFGGDYCKRLGNLK